MRKSPVNYVGNKFRLLPQLLKLFPKDINCFYDVFTGSMTVPMNVDAKEYHCNDNMYQLIDLYDWFSTFDHVDDLISLIKQEIDERSLSKTNKEAYILLREEYNKTPSSKLLYLLICHAFNNQIRFNIKHIFNSSFGIRSFNPSLEKNLRDCFEFFKRSTLFTRKNHFNVFMQSSLFNNDPNDFFYCDPPYLITNAVYNDGKTGWGEKEENMLLRNLATLNAQGTRFALSNVLEINGRKNEILEEFSHQYNVHELSINYDSCSAVKTNKGNVTREVLITNY